MCNLYSITTNQAAIIALFRVVNRYVGNLAPMPGVFPDYPAPVIRNSGGEREMIMMRWGMPPPPRTGGPPVTNIRNTSSPHWRMWLKPENRCLVPANSFAEYAPEPNPATGKKDVVWFALNDDRLLFGRRMLLTIVVVALILCVSTPGEAQDINLNGVSRTISAYTIVDKLCSSVMRVDREAAQKLI